MNKTQIYNIARTSLETNIAKLNKGLFLSAGSHQFKSFWTRDFCFSVRGLLAIDRYDVIKDHLSFLINNRRSDNLVPLYVDSMSPVLRVISQVFFKTIRLKKLSLPMKENIKPYYLVNNTYEAIDSNLMVLYASILYFKKTNDQLWFKENLPSFELIFNFYKSKIHEGLIKQNEHADWQDSARREGYTFFTNLLYFHMAREYQFLNELDLANLKQKIIQTFFDEKSGVFLSMAGRDNVSLEGNLWAIENDLLLTPHTLYENLKRHPLYNESFIPGFATYPSYTKDDTYIQVKIVGLQEYHGKIYWSWLIGYSAKIALLMKDFETFNKIYERLNISLKRDGTVYEIYENNSEMMPFRSFFYESESPFSWGASFILDMEKTKDPN
jgi:glycogen debranching enzyme